MTDFENFERQTRRNLSSLRGIEVYEISPRIEKKILEAEWDIAEDMLPHCPKCGEPLPDYVSKGWVTHEGLKDRPIGNAPLIINLKCRRYQCQSCGRTFGRRHPGMRKSSNLTDALVQHIAQNSITEEPHTSIAERTGVHESTVRKYHKRIVQLMKRGRSERHSPEAIGIDGVNVGYAHPNEKDRGKGGPSTIITSLDNEGGSVIEMLPNQDSGRLRNFLEEKITPSGEVLPVVIDMDETYRKAVRESRLPTVMVIDRYHIARLANRTLGNAKSEMLNTSSIRSEWKRRKKALKNRWTEKGPAPKQATTLGEESAEEGKATGELEKMELVLKSGLHFRSIMTCRDCSREEALDKYRDWKQNLDPAIRGFFKARVIDTVEDEMWWDGVMNFFEYPYTNGPVEGKNRLAKELRRKGAGYHNETIRMKMRANKSFQGVISLWDD